MHNTQDPKVKEDKDLTLAFEKPCIPPSSVASSELCVEGDCI